MTSRQKTGLWSLGPSVYLPSLLFAIGLGAIAPVVPLNARDLGASLATASLVVGMTGVGRVVGDLPAGQLATRVGERRSMLVALGIAVVALAGAIAAPSIVVLAAAMVVIGFAAAVFGLARHAYIAEVVPYRLRGRALSTLGGMNRIGFVVGPFLSAVVMRWLGTDGGYWVFLTVAVLAVGTLLVVDEQPGAARGIPASQQTGELRDTLRHVIRRHLPVLRTLGVAAVLVGAARAARTVAIPLWGEHIGLNPATTSLIFGLAGAIDMLMFYPAGLALDRLGRRRVVITSMVLLGVSLALIPLTQTAAGLTVVAMLTGLGNGLGSGMMMTIGADVSPAVSRAAFLGAWRLCVDTGDVVGPLAVGAATAVVSLTAAVAGAGMFGILAALLMARWIPRHGQAAP